jgi:hypothetical protein
MVKPDLTNQFFDIKSLKDWGILWFPISMARISTGQRANDCIKWLDFFKDKVEDPKVGINFVYCDFLYLNSNEPAKKLKEKFMAEIISHRNGLKKLIFKKRKEYQIQHAFHFETWGNLYLELDGDFNYLLKEIKELYKKDKLFQKYVKEDVKFFNRKLDQNQISFFLEEHLMAYLVLFKKCKFRNEYVQGREKWVLLAYPGIPPKAQIYLIQKNPFKFKTDNSFVGNYDLSKNKFYDYSRVSLDSWNYN